MKEVTTAINQFQNEVNQRILKPIRELVERGEVASYNTLKILLLINSVVFVFLAVGTFNPFVPYVVDFFKLILQVIGWYPLYIPPVYAEVFIATVVVIVVGVIGIVLIGLIVSNRFFNVTVTYELCYRRAVPCDHLGKQATSVNYVVAASISIIIGVVYVGGAAILSIPVVGWVGLGVLVILSLVVTIYYTGLWGIITLIRALGFLGIFGFIFLLIPFELIVVGLHFLVYRVLKQTPKAVVETYNRYDTLREFHKVLGEQTDNLYVAADEILRGKIRVGSRICKTK